jgi:hypothetical protein
MVADSNLIYFVAFVDSKGVYFVKSLPVDSANGNLVVLVVENIVMCKAVLNSGKNALGPNWNGDNVDRLAAHLLDNHHFRTEHFRSPPFWEFDFAPVAPHL